MPKQLTAQYALDAEHFIALWLAIHGGDPAPDQRSVLVGGAAVLQALSKVEAPALQQQVVGAMRKALEQF